MWITLALNTKTGVLAIAGAGSNRSISVGEAIESPFKDLPLLSFDVNFPKEETTIRFNNFCVRHGFAKQEIKELRDRLRKLIKGIKI